MTSTPVNRYPIVQLDLLNDTVVIPVDPNADIDFGDEDSLADKFRQLEIDADLKTKLMEKLTEFWHTDVDKLEAFAYYNDGHYICQRKRQKYDFKTESSYWTDYQFKLATSEQARELAIIVEAVFHIQQKANVINSVEKMEKRLKTCS